MLYEIKIFLGIKFRKGSNGDDLNMINGSNGLQITASKIFLPDMEKTRNNGRYLVFILSLSSQRKTKVINFIHQ
jgi:hypothetical protein